MASIEPKPIIHFNREQMTEIAHLAKNGNASAINQTERKAVAAMMKALMRNKDSCKLKMTPEELGLLKLKFSSDTQKPSSLLSRIFKSIGNILGLRIGVDRLKDMATWGAEAGKLGGAKLYEGPVVKEGPWGTVESMSKFVRDSMTRSTTSEVSPKIISIEHQQNEIGGGVLYVKLQNLHNKSQEFGIRFEIPKSSKNFAEHVHKNLVISLSDLFVGSKKV